VSWNMAAQKEAQNRHEPVTDACAAGGYRHHRGRRAFIPTQGGGVEA
jgi:hypothetical protein